MEQEQWLPIKGYEGLYEVSSMGRLKSLRRSDSIGRSLQDRIVTPKNCTNQYQASTLCKNGIKKQILRHRIVAMAFIPNPENKDEVNHKDGDKTNNKVSNLEWATKSENERHKYSVLGHGNPMKGKTGAENKKSKPVLQKDLRDNLIAKYDCATSAAASVGAKFSSGICRACREPHRVYYGYKWSYAT